MRVTVFAPDDLQLVKGGPAGRRDYLDDLLVALSPRYEAARADYERVLRQRNALLRGGLRGDDAVGTLDVFDLQLAAAGAELARGPAAAPRAAGPGGRRGLRRARGRAHADHHGLRGRVGRRPDGGSTADLDQALLDAFARAPARPRSTGASPWSGPHRDEWRLLVGGLESRTHASQGEQRTLALALRLGGHRLCARAHRQRAGAAPRRRVQRARRPARRSRSSRTSTPGQTLVTTAGAVPRGISADRMLRVDAGQRRGGRVSAPVSGARTPATSRCRSSDALAAVGAELGLARRQRARRRSTRAGPRWWAPTSRRTRGSVSVRDGVLTVAVDDPIWATQLRYLETAVVERATAAARPRSW